MRVRSPHQSRFSDRAHSAQERRSRKRGNVSKKALAPFLTNCGRQLICCPPVFVLCVFPSQGRPDEFLFTSENIGEKVAYALKEIAYLFT